jgi:hypothetical protein
VPDLVGLTLDEARSVLQGTGLVAVGPDPDAAPLAAAGWPDGVVVDQRPDPGTMLAIGSAVGHGHPEQGLIRPVMLPRGPIQGRHASDPASTSYVRYRAQL